MEHNQNAYRRAEKRVKAKLGFYYNMSIYIVICLLLIVINLITSPEYFWAKWPLMGWGIGILFHALGVFVFSGKSAIIQRMIEKEMKKDV